MRFTTRTHAALGALVAVALAAAGCGGGGSDASTKASKPKSEVVITCEACPVKATKDVFQQYRKELTDAFNAKYKGRYRIKATPYTPANDADAAQHYQRAAATDTLPDLFAEQATIVRDAARSGKLVDFSPILDGDGGWKASFKPGAFLSVSDDKGHVWGIPEGRDAVGIYYNKALFRKAGITQFPTTWDQMLQDCSQLKAANVIPFAMDGDWVTQLMWSNLIGTRPGGPAFLQSGIRNGNYASNPTVVQATEFLKQMHTSGCVNKDAFSGDYERAAAPFLDGQAAMIANGPWMVPDIKGSKKKIDAGYEASPGNGLLVIPGSEGWASGAKDDAKREAVTAFMKFMTSQEQMFRKALVTGSFWPTDEKLNPTQAKQLEPLAYHLLQEADTVAYTYPHAKYATPEAFTKAWTNDWPAYVQGKMSTKDFLNALSDAVQRQR
jgi:ABC-type glycerol-3-phosphate transport system substrate-binding protein